MLNENTFELFQNPWLTSKALDKATKLKFKSKNKEKQRNPKQPGYKNFITQKF